MVTSLLVLAVSSQAKLTKECLVDYLKFRNVHDEAFDSVDAYSGDPGSCSADVKAKVNDIYGVVRSKMEKHIRQKPYADCAMQEIEGEPYESLTLTAEAIDMKGVGIKFWKISSKNTKIEQLQAKAQEIVDSALIKCKGQHEYGAFFDTFYEQKRTEPMTNDFDYCMRQHLVNRGLISSKMYNFKVNPNNLRVGTIDCENIMKIATEQMKSSISGAGSTCVIDAFINNGYLDMIMHIQILSKLSLTEPEKQTEKTKFVNAMINMTHQIKTCPMQ